MPRGSKQIALAKLTQINSLLHDIKSLNFTPIYTLKEDFIPSHSLQPMDLKDWLAFKKQDQKYKHKDQPLAYVGTQAKQIMMEHDHKYHHHNQQSSAKQPYYSQQPYFTSRKQIDQKKQTGIIKQLFEESNIDSVQSRFVVDSSLSQYQGGIQGNHIRNKRSRVQAERAKSLQRLREISAERHRALCKIRQMNRKASERMLSFQNTPRKR